MKSPEQWAKDAFGFSYIDDVEPQTKVAFGTTGLLKQIKAIQDDAKIKLVHAVEFALCRNGVDGDEACKRILEDALKHSRVNPVA